MNIGGWVIAIALFVSSSACAGARASLKFDSLEYPVSTSGYLYTSSDEAFEVVGQLRYDTTAWAIFYSIIPLSGTMDLSVPINQQIERAKGQGVVNVTVAVEGCPMNYVWPLNWIPLWPGCTEVAVRGQIVRQGKSTAKSTGFNPLLSATEARDRVVAMLGKSALEGVLR